MPPSPLHALLLLSDSALPLGSFAFSSGLESHIVHAKAAYQTSRDGSGASSARQDPYKTSLADLKLFLKHSIFNTATTTLHFVMAAYRSPQHLVELDDVLDASTACTVARRASTTQGRALIGIWERALRDAIANTPSSQPKVTNGTKGDGESQPTLPRHIDAYISLMTPATSTVKNERPILPQAHLAPLFGAVARAMGLSENDAVYVYLLNHAKAVLSAAVRSGVIGPYVSQAVLASSELESWITEASEAVILARQRNKKEHSASDDWRTDIDAAGVSVPAMDLWMGRHEILYSRIFNS